ncbi:MAG: orotate phosphoribosyltransferase [Gemmatimonadota bacterium]|nr:MAG: orotate phosphoribosyltransferase [Gemmatimonadota bacterium]
MIRADESARANLDRFIALLKQRSLELGSFILSSGRQSSYYIDARRTTMSAAGLELVGSLGLHTIRAAGWEAHAVGGLTLGADPVAYAIALASTKCPPELDAFSVRKEPKEHGTGRLIEGCFRSGCSVVVTEDVITTGGSALTAIDAISDAGGQVLGVLAVVDREEGGRAAIEAGGYPVETLLTLADLGLTPPGQGG